MSRTITHTSKTINGLSNVIGNDAKTSYNKLTGFTKVDNRPSTVSTETYGLQIRAYQRDTSGAFTALDCIGDIKTTGTATMRGVQGVATVDGGVVATDTTLIGTYGQARNDGTTAGNTFMAGLYGLIEEGGGTTVAGHVCSAWLDTHVATAITGSYQLLYGTENGATALDQVMYFRTPGAVAFIEFDTCTAFMGSGAKSGGTAKTAKVTVDGVTHYINLWPS